MSTEQAKAAIEDYFRAFNARDEGAMRARLHFPNNAKMKFGAH